MGGWTLIHRARVYARESTLLRPKVHTASRKLWVDPTFHPNPNPHPSKRVTLTLTAPHRCRQVSAASLERRDRRGVTAADGGDGGGAGGAAEAALHDGACTFLHVRNGVTDEAMHALCGRLPALKTLILRGVKSLTADGLRAVGGLTALTHLDLRSCLIVTDAVLRELRDLTALSALHLSGCSNLTNAGLRKLRGLTAVANKVTDVGLQHLTCLNALTELWLTGTSTTQAARDARTRHTVHARCRYIP